MANTDDGLTQPGLARPAPRHGIRQVLVGIGVLGLFVAAVIGSNVGSVRDHLVGSALPEPEAPAVSRNAEAPADASRPASTAVRSAPWWQDVTAIDGVGAAITRPFALRPGAFQWRVRWTCGTGRLLVQLPDQAEPLIDAPCSETREASVAYVSRVQATSMRVGADGPWRLEVAQQIDSPLVEPRLAGMTATGTVPIATGTFRRVDQPAAGKVTIFDQADGRYTVRLDDFFVTPDTHLQLRLSTASAVHDAQDYLGAGRSQLLGVIDVTAGSFNYTAPLGFDPTAFGSVVVWCPPTNSAYAAASLEKPA